MHIPKSHVFRLYGPYLGRPVLWPEIWRREVIASLGRRLGIARWAGPTPQARRAQRDAGGRWCAGRAMDSAALLDRLGIALDGEPVQGRYAARYAVAEERARSCPYELGGAGNGDLLYRLARGIDAARVVETGVAMGWSSLALLCALCETADGRLWSVDLPYFERRNDDWVGCVVSDELRPRWRLLRCADREGLPRALAAAGRIDMAHYDSDKSEAGRVFAYPRLWRALRPGGLLVSDDVGDNEGFARFCDSVDAEPLVVADGDKYQGVLVKPGGAP